MSTKRSCSGPSIGGRTVCPTRICAGSSRGLVDVAELVATRLERRVILVRDPDDAVVVEAAIDGGADYLVTHNLRHFAEVIDVLSVVTPGELLRILAEVER